MMTTSTWRCFRTGGQHKETTIKNATAKESVTSPDLGRRPAVRLQPVKMNAHIVWQNSRRLWSRCAMAVPIDASAKVALR